MAGATAVADVPSETSASLQPTDLITSLPAPLLRLLVLFARPIAWGKIGLEVILWKSGRRVESWLVVVAWWGICLGGKYAFRWLLPVMIFLPLMPLDRLRLGKRSSPPRHDKVHPATHDVLLLTLSDLHSIHAQLPPSPLPALQSAYNRFALLSTSRLIRGLVIIWSTWVVLGKVIGFPALLAFVGSIILLLPSPFLAHIVNLLSRSLAVRRLAALTFLLVFGSPPDHSHPFSLDFSPKTWLKTKWATSRRPSLAFTFKPKVPVEPINESAIVDEEEEDHAASPIYFRFEVHENQRWWMGLDWTSALLPQERPSWCDSHLLPLSPPASFPLPPSSSIILPHPTKTDPNGRVKRIAEWRWLDDDWSIVRAGSGVPSSVAMIQSNSIPEDASGSVPPKDPRSPGSLGTSPQSSNMPSGEDLQTAGARAQSMAEQAFTKGLERLKARTGSPTIPSNRPQSMAIGSSPQRNSGEFHRGRTGSQASEDLKEIDAHVAAPIPMETIADRDDATDADGWVYGDNKWESTGPKGGLGRFTRRRRWHRRAVLTETVVRLPSDIPSAQANSASTEPPNTPFKARPVVEPQVVLAESRPTVSADESGSPPSSFDRRRSSETRGPSSTMPPSSPTRDDVLRQRLKRAMGNVGG